MALVDGFLELERSSGKLEWSAILQKMASDLGFSKILFGLLPKDSQDYENAFIVGNYPAAWREHYDRAGYARVDPTVSHCTQSVLPIFWEPSIYQTRKQHEFFEEASAAGLVYGLTMPLHGARGELGALSLSVEAENRAEANRFMESVLPTLWMLKDYALQSGAGLDVSRFGPHLKIGIERAVALRIELNAKTQIALYGGVLVEQRLAVS
ncbi:autoinducer binding domain-containing protein [Pseudomonas aeruginosa]|uniref:autoinducer binding domain-containing protein n=1 Tax=Pseudomonas aeruginosa TaxID=287 RepID=UPI0021BDDA56|nr:autoinducer binding domain-containing protein [Pseudomonas aeruginosa]MDP5955178.1 autoinducer binding domain-containing protein [Pseudomonas aeruginosa]MDP5961760.1 autoinducer binding domain-containing protein [Pseudomonas aeruginosa]